MKRFRDMRKDAETRDRFSEVVVEISDLIQPVFVIEGTNRRESVESMRGVDRLSPDLALDFCRACHIAGITTVLIFGVMGSSRKSPSANAAWDPDGPVQEAVRLLKRHVPGLTVVTDICLCAYTDHGHCGLVKDGIVLNDESLPPLARMALSHADAGVDMVAPSAMMDGQVAAIRKALDTGRHSDTKILSYSAKFASALYGPFRDAANSSPGFGDRRTYQMDYRNGSQAIDEVAADIDEGADMVMVKPAHWYADLIVRIKNEFPAVPIAAYQVSGEYSMLMTAAEKGFIDLSSGLKESFYALKRAGADRIITYAAKEYADEIRRS